MNFQEVTDKTNQEVDALLAEIEEAAAKAVDSARNDDNLNKVLKLAYQVGMLRTYLRAARLDLALEKHLNSL